MRINCFSETMQNRRQWRNILNTGRYYPGILYLVRMSFKSEDKIETLPTKAKRALLPAELQV